MTEEQVILTVFGSLFTIVLVPLCVNVFRRLRELERYAVVSGEFHAFLKTYLLREAVLTFHSNPNPDTDKIIEKIGKGERPTKEEYQKLEDKIRTIAETASEKKQRLKAESVLELLRWAFDDTINESVDRSAKMRNRLFTE